uniref:Glycosyltransferase n=1 Tax=candidate division WOR-3 bacterium TaxID=2052148 RepID=A0A7C4YGF1_UNCW3
MRILYFGTYSRDYIRNRVIIKGLKKNNVEVIECHYPLWKGVEPRIQEFKGIKGLIKLAFNFLKSYIILFLKSFDIVEKPDFIIVGYTGHFDIPLAFIISRFFRRKLVFDMFVSLYDTFVLDRKLVKNFLLKRLLRFIDRWSMILSDKVLLDTDTHIEYLSKEFNIDKGKFIRVWIGEDPEIFYPIGIEKNKFNVLYFGGYIPLHGVEFIVDAARELKDIDFTFIGRGQLYNDILKYSKGLKNIKFIDWMDLKELKYYISSASVSLGIFGNTDKAKRVIPNKIYEAIACKTPVLTSDTPAIREVFKHRENIYLCKIADADSIKNGILELKNSKKLREKIAENSHRLFLEKFTPEKIGKELLIELKRL